MGSRGEAVGKGGSDLGREREVGKSKVCGKKRDDDGAAVSMCGAMCKGF